MTIIVENGTQVAGANSYVSVSDVIAYATARNETLPISSKIEPLIIKSMDYIESFRAAYKGWKTLITQALQWPRAYVEIDPVSSVYRGGYYGGYNVVDPNTIPQQLKDAQCQVVIELAKGIDPWPNQTGLFIKRAKVDTLEVEYSEAIATDAMPTLPKVNTLLAPLLLSRASGPNVPIGRS